MRFLKGFIVLAACFILSACARESFQNNLQNESDIRGVIGGTVVSSRNTVASKSVVYIELLNKAGQEISFCTATLIGKNTVLTAAHCFDPKLIPAKKFNVVFADKVSERLPRISRLGYKFKSHPDYNSLIASGEKRRFGDRTSSPAYDHDIAVATFVGDLPEGYAPIELDADETADYSGQTVHIFGYGRSVDYVGNKSDFGRGRSSGTLRKGTMIVSSSYGAYEDRYFTSRDSENFLCQGDSGGPQFYVKGSSVKIIGVNSAAFGVSLKNKKKTCAGFSQGTKVAYFHRWIRQQERKLQP